MSWNVILNEPSRGGCSCICAAGLCPSAVLCTPANGASPSTSGEMQSCAAGALSHICTFPPAHCSCREESFTSHGCSSAIASPRMLLLANAVVTMLLFVSRQDEPPTGVWLLDESPTRCLWIETKGMALEIASRS